MFPFSLSLNVTKYMMVNTFSGIGLLGARFRNFLYRFVYKFMITFYNHLYIACYVACKARLARHIDRQRADVSIIADERL